MIKKAKYFYAGIVLMLVEKNINRKMDLTTCLFTEEEIINKARELAELAGNEKEFKSFDFNSIIRGENQSSPNKYIVRGPEGGLNEYFRLVTSEEENITIDELNGILEGIKRTEYDIEKISEVLDDYYKYIELRKRKPFIQKEYDGLISREAVWIAGVTMTYNEIIRTASKDPKKYYFQPSAIGRFAHILNRGNTLTTCRQMISANCTDGNNNQGYSYFIPSGSLRRLAYPCEKEITKPEINGEYVVETIVGSRTVSEMYEYLKMNYGKNFLDEQNETVFASNLNEPEEEVSEKNENNPYTEEDFLKEVFWDEEQYKRCKHLLLNKKNIILQGAPGVGKTFIANRLAYAIMEEKDDSRIEIVQFHQNYSYEDFINGYRPVESGFELRDGIFYRFCKEAANHEEKEYFFIIDEINRGNLSKIFGELLMLIEKDYRGKEIKLMYSQEPFSIPPNLYIIGMMNTADRSLSIIDYALRRRFGFIEVSPAFKSKGFKQYQNELNHEEFNKLVEKIIELNEEIKEDISLGRGFCIGHSYLCGRNATSIDREWIRTVIECEIIPLIEEYWYDDLDRVEEWRRKFMSVIR